MSAWQGAITQSLSVQNDETKRWPWEKLLAPGPEHHLGSCARGEADDCSFKPLSLGLEKCPAMFPTGKQLPNGHQNINQCCFNYTAHAEI
jgi:hypothetical protein